MIGLTRFLRAAMVLAALSASVHAAQGVTLAWTPSTNTDVVGYHVYYGGASRSYTNMVTVGSTTNAAIPGLVPGAEYFFAAMAVDSAGMESVFSNEVSYQVPLTTTPPTIALTSPVNGATCTAPGTMTLAASVTANSHTITQVQFYNGTTMLGASTSAPYTMTWNNVSAGSYSLTAQAVYDSGSTVVSSAVSVTVTAPPTTPPTIALTSPVNGATCTAPGTMTLAASVTANSHTITQVQFYNGTTMLGASTSAPYTMTWNNVSAGSYSLTAQAVYDSGSTVVSSAVNVTVTAPPPSGGGVLFSDNFSAGLSPWVSKQGTWTVAGGALKGSSTVDDYGTAYYNTNGWSNYTYQASIRFSISNGAYGGGIGGRLNAANGAHYTAWVFPEGSSGGSCVIKLMKFTGWTTWTGTAMGQASLSSVGTNWHTVALAFQGAGITVSYDGVQKISVTDNSFGSVAPYSTGGITADLGTYPTAFTLFVSNVSVTAPTGATQAAGVPLVRRLNGAGSTVVSPPLNVKVVDLPAPWQTADIGSVGVAGSASVSKAIYTVNGAGTISGTADSFRFVYQRLSGNGELTVRLNPAENKGSGRFGVMVRESLTKGSEYAFLGISPDGTLRWQGRSKTGGSTLSAASTIGAQQSVWVRIVRTGNVLYGYQSTDGTHWTKVNSQTITMATQVYAGLAVASGSAETLSAATFANVTVVP